MDSTIELLAEGIIVLDGPVAELDALRAGIESTSILFWTGIVGLEEDASSFLDTDLPLKVFVKDVVREMSLETRSWGVGFSPTDNFAFFFGVLTDEVSS